MGCGNCDDVFGHPNLDLIVKCRGGGREEALQLDLSELESSSMPIHAGTCG